MMNDLFQTVLESIDREIAFFRRRAGQVFFFGLLVEAFILTGKGKITMPENWTWQRPYLGTLFFLAVLAVGVSLGSEYRRRIRFLKKRRRVLFINYDLGNVYPDLEKQILSEIEVLYVSLFFLSSAGILISWLQYINKAWLATAAFLLSFFAVGFAIYWICKSIMHREHTDVSESDVQPR